MKFSMRRRRAPHNSRAKAMAPSSETSSTASSNEFDSASLHHSSVAEEEVSTSSLGTHDLLPVGQKMQASLLRGTWNIDAEDQTWIDFDAKDVIQRDIDAIALSREFPDATLEECIRFRSRRSIEQARVKLKGYLEWRTFYLLDQIPPYQSQLFSNDEQVWNFAVNHALKFFPAFKLETDLPRFLRVVGHDANIQYTQIMECHDCTRSKSGKRVVLILSGLIDSRIAPLELYALAFAMYFDLILDRQSLDDIVFAADVRKGKGWRNASPATMIPFLKHLVKQMDQFPERLDTCYVYPVPSLAKGLWTMIKGFLKENVVDKVDIHWGNALKHATCPPRTLERFFDEKTIEDLERNRRSEFC